MSFIAKFQQVSNNSTKFTADKNGQMPFIGTVLAGSSKGTLINGTVFTQQGLKPNALYLCENEEREYTNPETGKVTTQHEVVIAGEISALDYLAAKAQLGAGKLVRATVAVGQPAEQPIA